MNRFLLLIPFFILSCGSQQPSEDEQTESKDTLQSSIISFETPIRPDVYEWDISETYTDTLTFDAIDDNYDYWYANFKTSSGQNVGLVCNNLIEENLGGSLMLVEWEIDSLYEAGEGDELYFKERLLSYEILQKGNTVSDFLNDGLVKDLLKNDPEILKKYLHPEQDELYHSYNPGVYCVLGGGGFLPEFRPEFENGYGVFEAIPNGHFCEGYEGVADGFYCQKINGETELPEFYDMSGDDENWRTETPYVPMGGADETYKITVVAQEYHYVYFYVILLYDEFYLWLIDYCDCSA